jgi:hypothetical protein
MFPVVFCVYKIWCVTLTEEHRLIQEQVAEEHIWK